MHGAVASLSNTHTHKILSCLAPAHSLCLLFSFSLALVSLSSVVQQMTPGDDNRVDDESDFANEKKHTHTTTKSLDQIMCFTNKYILFRMIIIHLIHSERNTKNASFTGMSVCCCCCCCYGFYLWVVRNACARAHAPTNRNGVYVCARNLVSEWVLNSGFIKRCFHHFSSLHHSHVRIQNRQLIRTPWSTNRIASVRARFFFVFCVCVGFRLDELSVVALLELGTFFFLASVSLSFSLYVLFLFMGLFVSLLCLCARSGCFFFLLYFHFFCHFYFHCCSCLFYCSAVFPHSKLDICTSVHNVLFKLN